jgi:SSS family solute:Na+ symporter
VVREIGVEGDAVALVKFGALAFVLGMNTQNAINLQLLGGIWILQTFPSVAIGLFTRWLHRWALIAGWLAGMVYGSYEAYGVSTPTVHHFAGAIADIPGVGHTGYIALTALVLNLGVAVVLSAILRLFPRTAGVDVTAEDDYVADRGDQDLRDVPSLAVEPQRPSAQPSGSNA